MRSLSILLIFTLLFYALAPLISTASSSAEKQNQEGSEEDSLAQVLEQVNNTPLRGKEAREEEKSWIDSLSTEDIMISVSVGAMILGLYLLFTSDVNRHEDLISTGSASGGWYDASTDEEYDYYESEWGDGTYSMYGVRYTPDSQAVSGMLLSTGGLIGLVWGLAMASKAKVEIVDWTSRLSSTGNYIFVEGTLKNISDTTAKSVRVKVESMDAKGVPVSFDDAHAKPYTISPGQEASFKVWVENNPWTEIEHFKLSVHGDNLYTSALTTFASLGGR